MFEQPKTEQEKDRSQLIITVSIAAVVIVVGLVILVASRSSKQSRTQPEMARPGSPEFDSYAPFVKIIHGERDKFTGRNMLGHNIAILRARVQNTGEQTIVGLQLRGVALGFNDEVLAQKIQTPVPRQQDVLKPGETMQVEIQIDPIPNPDQIRAMEVQLYALKLR
jgi:hypothetical protein